MRSRHLRARFPRPWSYLVLTGTLVLSSCDTDPPKVLTPPGTNGGEEQNDATATENRRVVGELNLLVGQIEAASNQKKWSEASRLIDRGLKRVGKGTQFELVRARFLLLRGNLGRDRGDVLDSRRDYADAMAIFRVQGDPVGRFEVHLAQGKLEETLGDQAAAARQVEEAANLLPEVKDDKLRGIFLVNTGRLASRSMKHKEAYEAFLEAAKIFASLKDRSSQAQTMIYLADTEDALGKTEEGRRSLLKALSLYTDAADKHGKVVALRKLASLAERDQNFQKARSLLQEVKAIYEELGKQGDAIKVDQHMNSLPEPAGKK